MIEAYRVNYEQIARDHLAHWRETGVNPWQSAVHVEAVGQATAQLVHAYSDMGAKILDAGCAMGDLLLRIEGRERYGCDFNADYLEVAAGRGITVRQCDLEAMPYANDEFDLVVTTDVLEHVLDLNRVIWEMLRVLRPGGHLVIRSPDGEDLTGYLSPDYPYQFAHLRRFDEPSFRLLLSRVFGLEIVQTERVFGTAWEINVVAKKP
jgi:ubiquinone/menaquinone biosynthesis C-methylase UbiE